MGPHELGLFPEEHHILGFLGLLEGLGILLCEHVLPVQGEPFVGGEVDRHLEGLELDCRYAVGLEMVSDELVDDPVDHLAVVVVSSLQGQLAGDGLFGGTDPRDALRTEDLVRAARSVRGERGGPASVDGGLPPLPEHPGPGSSGAGGRDGRWSPACTRHRRSGEGTGESPCAETDCCR